MAVEGETVALEFIPIAERCLQYLGKVSCAAEAQEKGGQRRCPISSYFCFDTYHRRSGGLHAAWLMVYGYEKHLNCVLISLFL